MQHAYHKVGYIEGMEEGKVQYTVQGFDQGWQDAFPVGCTIGQLSGAAQALTALAECGALPDVRDPDKAVLSECSAAGALCQDRLGECLIEAYDPHTPVARPKAAEVGVRLAEVWERPDEPGPCDEDDPVGALEAAVRGCAALLRRHVTSDGAKWFVPMDPALVQLQPRARPHEGPHGE